MKRIFFNKEDFKPEDFVVKKSSRAGSRFNGTHYITYYITKFYDRTSSFYLHKDGRICNICGPENFFESEEEARDHIYKCFGVLTDKDFEL